MLITYEKNNQIKQVVGTDKEVMKKELNELLEDKNVTKIYIDNREVK